MDIIHAVKRFFRMNRTIRTMPKMRFRVIDVLHSKNRRWMKQDHILKNPMSLMGIDVKIF
jgi:hypothetical protein